MTCEKFAEMLDNYESLTDEEMALMSEHADNCEACRSELDFMRSMINAVKTLPEMKVPEDFLENLNKRIDAEETSAKRKGIAGHIRFNWQKYSAAAACLVLAAVIGANYDTLINNMNGGDDGVISTVTTVSSPAPDTGDITALAVVPAETAVPADNTADKTEKSDTQQSGSDTVPGGTSGFRRQSGNTSRQENTSASIPAAEYASPQIPASAQPESAEAPAEEQAAEAEPITGGSTETLTLPRGIYVEARGARSNTQTAETEAPDNPYEINAMAEMGDEYAVATVEDTDEGSASGGSAADDNGLGYELNQSNMIVVNGEDFATAFDIISRYASDSYSNYFIITADDFFAMLSALDEAGVRYHDNIAADTDKISFRISIG